MKPIEFNAKYGPWAIVTGASSGIGEEFCRQLAALNLNLILVARDKDGLERVSQELIKKNHIQTVIACVDLSEVNFIEAIVNLAESYDVGLLVNNAGFALTGDFLGHALKEELSLLHVNSRAPLVLSHIFGKKMVMRGSGGIINVSSASGFLPLPFWANYAASKAYVLHFSEALWFELKDKNVDVLALCPGATRTNFSKTAGTKNGGMEPFQVVELGLKKLGKRSVAIVGVGNRIISFMNRLFPRQLLTKIGARAVKGFMLDK